MQPTNALFARAACARPSAPFTFSMRPFAQKTTTIARSQCLVCATTTARRAYAASAAITDRRNLPRVIQPSLWQNMVPKHFRSKNKRPFTWKEWRAKPWNPASVWIAFGLVVGSNAINTLVLRRDIADFTRKADAKIALLREVLEKVQRGEEVDVERILGTGREESEKDWDEGRCSDFLSRISEYAWKFFFLKKKTPPMGYRLLNSALVANPAQLYKANDWIALKEIEEEDRTLQSRKRRKAAAAETAPPAAPATDSTPATNSKDASAKVDYVVPQDRRGPVGFY